MISTFPRKLPKRLSQMQVIAIGFFVIILTGSLLLMLPIASKTGDVTPFGTTIFTATSATCVTGLILVDTFTHWSMFGQIVILCLIQIGGLGFITFGFGISILLKRKIGIRQRGMLKESVSVVDMGGIVKLALIILKGTILFEGIGAIILSACFIPKMGIGTGIYYGIFHSISAFCNAGFDLMGRFTPFSSLTGFYDNGVVIVTIGLLILIGGIGFFVWSDIYTHKLHFRRYALHTKIVLIGTLILTAGGAVLFFLLENHHLFADMSTSGKILSSFFCAVTPRTAGFNSIDSAALTESGKLLTIALMFIGGAPGSTAGGIKITTIVVLLLYLRSTFTRTESVNIFKRRLETGAITKATAVFCTNLFLVLIASFIICTLQNLDITDILFEVVSAMSTVGMSLGITQELTLVPQILLISLMYIGRLGSLSFALSFTDKKKLSHISQPQEHISIG